MSHRRTSWLLVAAVGFISTPLSFALPRIAYSPDQTALSILDQPAGTVTPVPTSGFGGQIVNAPDWSSDGQWLAFHAGPSGSAQIYAFHPDGTGQYPLGTSAAGDSVSPDFSPDGSKILFQGGSRQLWTVNSNGTGLVSLPAYGVEPRWSPNGAFIAYGGQPTAGSGAYLHDVYLYNTVTQSTSILVDPAGSDQVTSVAWSPDGQQIAAAVSDTSSGASKIVIYDSVSGAQLNDLTTGFTLTGSTYLDWAPSGEKLVFSGRHSGNYDLWDVNVAGVPVFNNLTNTAGVAEWAPSVIPEPASAGCLLAIFVTAAAGRQRRTA